MISVHAIAAQITHLGETVPVLIDDINLMLPVTEGGATNRVHLALESTTFKDWLQAMAQTNHRLHSIFLQSVDMFGKKLGFIKASFTIVKPDGHQLNRIVFMRGGSVAVALELICEGQSYALLTDELRTGTGGISISCFLAGMLDGSGNFVGKAVDEIREESSLEILPDELIDLTELCYGHLSVPGVYASPGGTDEFFRLFYCEKHVSRELLDKLDGLETGLGSEDERIVVRIVPWDHAWQYMPDAKGLAALFLLERVRVRSALDDEFVSRGRSLVNEEDE